MLSSPGGPPRRVRFRVMFERIPNFAYGSNMWPAQMEDRCPGATVLGHARLLDHRFVINERGVATVLSTPGSDVLGVLWNVTSDHLRSQDVFEGLAEGRYVRDVVRVHHQELGHDIEASIYLACHTTPGNPREGYLERVIDGAVHFRLDESYVDQSIRPWAAEVLE